MLHAVERLPPPPLPLHPQAVLILTRTVPAGLETAFVPAPSTHQPKRDNTVQDPAASVEKIPEDDRPNDHPPPRSLN